MSRRTLPLSVATVVLVLLGSGVNASGADQHPEWGTTSAPDQVLRKGCHGDTYSWDIDPPDGTWALETFIKGPRGKSLGSGALTADFDPKQGTGKFRICKATTATARSRSRRGCRSRTATRSTKRAG